MQKFFLLTNDFNIKATLSLAVSIIKKWDKANNS